MPLTVADPGRESDRSKVPSVRLRVLMALIVGAAAYYLSVRITGALWPDAHAHDLTQNLRAAAALLSGNDPYKVIRISGAYPADHPYNYPLTAAILCVPLALIGNFSTALHTFVGVTSALAAYAVTKDGFHRMPLFLSFSYFWGVLAGQWGPAVIAGGLVPSLGFLLAAKPNLGIALFAAWPNRRAAIAGAILVLLAFALLPEWFVEWQHVARLAPDKVAPVTVLTGPLLLLAMLRWRLAEARLLLVMAAMPQAMNFYDQLPLWLIPRTARGTLWLTTFSIAAWGLRTYDMAGLNGIAAMTTVTAPYLVALLYLPCLVMVLRRPNEGCLPSVAERFVERVGREVMLCAKRLRRRSDIR